MDSLPTLIHVLILILQSINTAIQLGNAQRIKTMLRAQKHAKTGKDGSDLQNRSHG